MVLDAWYVAYTARQVESSVFAYYNPIILFHVLDSAGSVGAVDWAIIVYLSSAHFKVLEGLITFSARAVFYVLDLQVESVQE